MSGNRQRAIAAHGDAADMTEHTGPRTMKKPQLLIRLSEELLR